MTVVRRGWFLFPILILCGCVGLTREERLPVGDEVDFETYPKATGSYVISEEEFFQDALGSIFDEL